MRGDDGKPTHAMPAHLLGRLLFPNAMMMDPQTWRDIFERDDRGAECARMGLDLRDPHFQFDSAPQPCRDADGESPKPNTIARSALVPLRYPCLDHQSRSPG